MIHSANLREQRLNRPIANSQITPKWRNTSNSSPTYVLCNSRLVGFLDNSFPTWTPIGDRAILWYLLRSRPQPAAKIERSASCKVEST
jgi:hypothetical protein